ERMGRPAHPRRERSSLWGARWTASAAAAAILVSAAAAIVLRGPARTVSAPVADSPVLRDALADCRRVMGRNFPRKADLAAIAEGLPFAVRALDKPGAELFSTWKTTLGGAPAAGLADRWK